LWYLSFNKTAPTFCPLIEIFLSVPEKKEYGKYTCGYDLGELD
jgi:hypothetical protein